VLVLHANFLRRRPLHPVATAALQKAQASEHEGQRWTPCWLPTAAAVVAAAAVGSQVATAHCTGRGGSRLESEDEDMEAIEREAIAAQRLSDGLGALVEGGAASRQMCSTVVVFYASYLHFQCIRQGHGPCCISQCGQQLP